MKHSGIATLLSSTALTAAIAAACAEKKLTTRGLFADIFAAENPGEPGLRPAKLDSMVLAYDNDREVPGFVRDHFERIAADAAKATSGNAFFAGPQTAYSDATH